MREIETEKKRKREKGERAYTFIKSFFKGTVSPLSLASSMFFSMSVLTTWRSLSPKPQQLFILRERRRERVNVC